MGLFKGQIVIMILTGSRGHGQQVADDMGAASDYVWCNRQIITHSVRQVFNEVFEDKTEVQMHLIYDVVQNN